MGREVSAKAKRLRNYMVPGVAAVITVAFIFGPRLYRSVTRADCVEEVPEAEVRCAYAWRRDQCEGHCEGAGNYGSCFELCKEGYELRCKRMPPKPSEKCRAWGSGKVPSDPVWKEPECETIAREIGRICAAKMRCSSDDCPEGPARWAGCIQREQAATCLGELPKASVEAVVRGRKE